MLREVATLAFLNLGGGVELFFSYNNLNKLTTVLTQQKVIGCQEHIEFKEETHTIGHGY